jgi:L-fuconolactonase
VAGAAATALPLSSLTFAASKDAAVAELPIVDTHQHLWDLKLFTLPWMKGEEVEPINRSFVSSDYLAATKGLNVVKAVYMEVNVEPSQQVKEAEYVFDICKKGDTPMVAAVIGGSPQEKAFAGYVKKLSASKYLKGVRTVLHDPDRPKGMCLTPTFVDNMKLLGDLGLCFDLCMRQDEISDGAKLAEKCPRTRFVVDHCGNIDVSSTDEAARKKCKEGLKAAAALPNTICKISGIVFTAKKDWKAADLAPDINFCLDTFGEDRVIFGGDWPVCTIKATFSQWVTALKEIVKGRPAAFQKKLFHDNAEKFYGLA